MYEDYVQICSHLFEHEQKPLSKHTKAVDIALVNSIKWI